MLEWLTEPNRHQAVKGLRSMANYLMSPVYRANARIRHVCSAKGVFSTYLSRRLMDKHQIQVSPKAVIGKDVLFMHPIGVVVGDGVVIGDDVTVYQNVTLGQKDGSYPIVENGVTIYANAVICGGIVLGEGSVIGAGSIVLKTVERYSVVGGVPAKRLKTLPKAPPLSAPL